MFRNVRNGSSGCNAVVSAAVRGAGTFCSTTVKGICETCTTNDRLRVRTSSWPALLSGYYTLNSSVIDDGDDDGDDDPTPAPVTPEESSSCESAGDGYCDTGNAQRHAVQYRYILHTKVRAA